MDISRYKREIDIILNHLKNLQMGDYYEITGNKTDGSFRKEAMHVYDSFADLILKIVNDKEGIQEKLDKFHIP